MFFHKESRKSRKKFVKTLTDAYFWRIIYVNKREIEVYMADSLEVALIKYNKKSWFKSALLGLLIGIAVIVPGISGSTVAIIFKLYDQFLYAVGNLFKKFKKCFLFLLPIGLGLIVGFALGFIGVKKLLEINMLVIVCLFAGLMCGAFPAVHDEIKGIKWDAKRVILFVLGLLIPVALGCVSAVMTVQTPAVAETVEKAGDYATRFAGNAFFEVEWWHILLAVVFGFVIGITQIVPGLSASAFLMAIGWYNSLMQSVSMTFWKGNPMIFLVYAGLGIGFLLGIFFFSKFLTWVFGKARHTAYCMIVGLSLGSIISMFCNGDVMGVYLHWASGSAEWWHILLSVGIGVVLFAVGLIGAYLLVRVERKKDAEKAKQSANNNVDNSAQES